MATRSCPDPIFWFGVAWTFSVGTRLGRGVDGKVLNGGRLLGGGADLGAGDVPAAGLNKRGPEEGILETVVLAPASWEPAPDAARLNWGISLSGGGPIGTSVKGESASATWAGTA